MIDKPDYESYSIKELKEALSGINGAAYPDRLEELKKLLSLRQSENPEVEAKSIYVGFWFRLIAYIWDFIFLGIPIAILTSSYYGAGSLNQSNSANILYALILIGFWSIKGATPGKIFTGMKIIDINTGKKPSYLKSALRYVGYILSVIPLLLGFFWVLWHPQKRAWHDLLSGTVVIWEEVNYMEHLQNENT